MKLLIAFALIAAAAALPEPVELPQAPVPAVEDGPVELPNGEEPAYEDAEPVYEPIPFIPPSLMEEQMRLARLEEIAAIRASAVNFVDNAEEEPMDVYDGEQAEVAYQDADIPVDDTVKVAQSPDEVPDNIEDYVVRIVESANPDELSQLFAAGELESIRLDFPIPDAEGQVPVDERLQQNGPGKVYDNPLLR